MYEQVNEKWRVIGMASLGIAILLVAVGVWVCSSYFEAQAFNHITGKSVSTWDAMFVELRVQEPSK